MKKLFLIPIIALFFISCSKDEVDFEPCVTDACAYELLSELNLDGVAVGDIEPRIDYFTSYRYYPASMSDIKSSVAISLGFNTDQINALVSNLSINPEIVTNLIENNRNSIKLLLYFSDWKDRSTFWYESVNYWIQNQDSELSEDFEDFFEEYGHLNRFPYGRYPKSKTPFLFSLQHTQCCFLLQMQVVSYQGRCGFYYGCNS